MTGIGYREIEEAKAKERSLLATLKAQRREERRAVDAKYGAEIEAERIRARQAECESALADGGSEIAGHVVIIRGKRSRIIPRDPSESVTRGDERHIGLLATAIKANAAR